MSVPVKRKRGRPRLDEPKEIKDFDKNLILEFKKYPVFYDRQHPQHRNREYTDRIWQRIAQSLNVSSNLVKTRMLQLRNRFNLEKRRVEAIQEQQPDTPIISQWSLYEKLSFLSNYVKTRRPYSLPLNYNTKGNSSSTSSEVEEDDDEGVDDANATEVSVNDNQILTNDNSLDNRENGVEISLNQHHLSSATVSTQQIQQINEQVDINNGFVNKYKAFGQFLSSSLIEMNDVQALNLVEKFTTELVRHLKIEERKKSFIKTSQKNKNAGDDENSLTIY